jgi:hypothetical protein
MGINCKQAAAHASGTSQADWEFTSGPKSGVGVDYWLRNEKHKMTACVNITLGELNSVEVTSDDAVAEDEDQMIGG